MTTATTPTWCKTWLERETPGFQTTTNLVLLATGLAIIAIQFHQTRKKPDPYLVKPHPATHSPLQSHRTQKPLLALAILTAALTALTTLADSLTALHALLLASASSPWTSQNARTTVCHGLLVTVLLAASLIATIVAQIGFRDSLTARHLRASEMEFPRQAAVVATRLAVFWTLLGAAVAVWWAPLLEGRGLVVVGLRGVVGLVVWGSAGVWLELALELGWWDRSLEGGAEGAARRGCGSGELGQAVKGDGVVGLAVLCTFATLQGVAVVLAVWWVF